MTFDAAARSALEARFGDRALSRPVDVEPYRRDASHLVGHASAVVRPEGSEEVEDLVRWARRHRVGLVARGAGTSLDGESVPLGSVVIDLSRWTQVLEVDPTDRVARVQPGVVNHDLQRAAEEIGLFFPPNPGSWRTSTIGGNVATNASGPRSFRYGPTRSWVRAAQVVLGSGERLGLGSRAPKRSIGPDLLQLLIGSEGTLGIFTEITVALTPVPHRRAALGVPLPTGLPLGPLVAGLAASLSDGLTSVEYLDQRSAAALARTPGSRFPSAAALVLLEVESASEPAETERLERLVDRLRSLGVPGDPIVFADADRLWSLRGESSTALDREMGERVREDICVPVSRLDEMLRTIDRLGRDAGVTTCVYGHLGEASVHPNFAVDPATPEGLRLREALLRAALQLGGVISGEHGIGAIKPPWLADQVGPAGIDILRAVKTACDPDGILNPGKVLPAGATELPGDRPLSASPEGGEASRTRPA